MSDAEDCVVKSLERASGRRGIAGWTRERSERIQRFGINWSRGFLWTRKSAAAAKKKEKEKRGVKKWNLYSSSSFSPYATLETKNPNISTAFGCWIHRLKFPIPVAVRPSQNIKLNEDGMKLKSCNLYLYSLFLPFPSFLSEPWCCYNPIAFSYSTADGNPGGDNPFLLWLLNGFLFFIFCSMFIPWKCAAGAPDAVMPRLSLYNPVDSVLGKRNWLATWLVPSVVIFNG